MTVNRGLWVPINTGNVGTTEVEARLADNASYESNDGVNARSGLLNPTSTTIVTGKANMSFDLAACNPVINRVTGEGVYRFAATGVTNVTTTAAPGANSRIDVIWVKQNDQSKTDANNLAVVGVTQGVVAASPTAPAIPAGALEIARATITANMTATNTATITQTFRYTALAGTPIPVRDSTERAEITAPRVGQRVRMLDKNVVRIYDGTNWVSNDKWEATTGASGLSGGTVYNLGIITVDTSGENTTSSSFITTGANSSLVFRDAGDYLITITEKMSVASTGRAFVSLETANTGGTTMARGSIPNGEDTGGFATLVTVTAGQSLFPKFFHSNGSPLDISGRIKVKRIMTGL